MYFPGFRGLTVRIILYTGSIRAVCGPAQMRHFMMAPVSINVL